MKLTLKMKLTLDEVAFDALREISEYSGKFYNMVNYDFRNGNFMSFYDMYDYYKDHIRCKYLQAHTYENALKQFSKDYKSYQELLKNHKKNPNKHNQPSMPRYKHANNPMDAIFAKRAIRISLKKTGDLMSIDLGVKNSAAITFMNQKHQYLMDGNVLKCQMATYNKWLKEAVSKEMKNTGSKYFKATKKLEKNIKIKRIT